MKHKTFETFLYSIGGIAAMAVLLAAINMIVSAVPLRADLTAGKIYTLSPGTRAILSKLKSPVTIRFYCTRNVTPTAESLYLENYGRQVEDLLDEYKEAGGSKIIIQKFDPEPDSDAADSARLDGIQPETLPTGDKFYLGLAVSRLDTKQTVKLSPARQRLLEYDISRAITEIVNPQKAVVGVMSSLPVFGQQANPMMERMGRGGGGQPPWELINELKSDYTVRQVPLNADKIDKDIKVLLVIHPRGITAAGQYAIDQFVLRGGKLIAFLDPLSVADARNQNPMMGGMPQMGASTLNKLLDAWGIHFDSSKVVADLNFKMQVADQNGQPADAPAFLDVTSSGMNTNNIITADLSDVWLPYVGAFSGTPVAGLKETVLLKSTKDAELTPAQIYDLSGPQILQNFTATSVEYPLAIELTGKFKTAFPDGPPSGDTNAVSETPSLKEGAGNNTVILVGDSDMLSDQFALRQVNTIFGTMAMELNDNLSFVQNAIGQMAGNSDLIAMRSRGVENRPFTVIKKMEASAEMQYQSKIKELQDSLSETEQRLSELQTTKSQNQRYILSPQQQAQIASFRKKEAKVRSDLKRVQKDLRQDVVALQTHFEWLNIAAMPAMVSVFGLGMAFWKRKKTSAK